MAKRSPAPLSERLESLKKKSNKQAALDQPNNHDAAEDVRLYLALCVLGACPLNWSGYTEKRLPEFGVKMSPGSLRNWAVKDTVIDALLNLPKTRIARDYLARARKMM